MERRIIEHKEAGVAQHLGKRDFEAEIEEHLLATAEQHETSIHAVYREGREQVLFLQVNARPAEQFHLLQPRLQFRFDWLKDLPLETCNGFVDSLARQFQSEPCLFHLACLSVDALEFVHPVQAHCFLLLEAVKSPPFAIHLRFQAFFIS